MLDLDVCFKATRVSVACWTWRLGWPSHGWKENFFGRAMFSLRRKAENYERIQAC